MTGNMATDAQARLEVALQGMLDLDYHKERRTGAAVTQDDAALAAMKAAETELQAASLAAPDTLLPPPLPSALRRVLAEGCGRGAAPTRTRAGFEALPRRSP
ncbi:hypothetical protein MNEG_4573 [Monoraphidium neglectum]|jgi:hypothetical protein|uniref:Uncharacterized protein n=1 Tax=Monoraphidium neglectum TaxID=145388 RepID=A0A0D2MK97_9CHLO|nr:hypothetical protein MNEG_4573 [Monoraphidium neglectum]KIZ03390.1 hypothetical protein MNEG_4573 [Monoraphidium neglectum]|eukprot:XP_013902409.1 hypothetical protein MNEG_4573 [Monoraphidium neglectum]